ncbi:hypothetical protein PybrP1_005876 [[Pythium] brassicae (nom. inval.)]|nr:hypothetical protein PybrP1_005876 [[Pythium] brassicae (nom. inval.)]
MRRSSVSVSVVCSDVRGKLISIWERERETLSCVRAVHNDGMLSEERASRQPTHRRATQHDTQADGTEPKKRVAVDKAHCYFSHTNSRVSGRFWARGAAAAAGLDALSGRDDHTLTLERLLLRLTLDAEDAHAVELRELGEDERGPDRQVDAQVQRVVVRRDRREHEEHGGHDHEEALRAGPRVALVDLLVERQLAVVAHHVRVVRRALDPVHDAERHL